MVKKSIPNSFSRLGITVTWAAVVRRTTAEYGIKLLHERSEESAPIVLKEAEAGPVFQGRHDVPPPPNTEVPASHPSARPGLIIGQEGVQTLKKRVASLSEMNFSLKRHLNIIEVRKPEVDAVSGCAVDRPSSWSAVSRSVPRMKAFGSVSHSSGCRKSSRSLAAVCPAARKNRAERNGTVKGRFRLTLRAEYRYGKGEAKTLTEFAASSLDFKGEILDRFQMAVGLNAEPLKRTLAAIARREHA